MPAGLLAWLATLLSVLAGAGTGALLLDADSPTVTPTGPASEDNVTYAYAEPTWCPVPAVPQAPPPYHREFRGQVGPGNAFPAFFPVDNAWLADRLVVKTDAPMSSPVARYRLTVDDNAGRTLARVDGAGALQAVVEDFPRGGTWRATLTPLTPVAPAEVALDVTLTFVATPPPAPSEWRFLADPGPLGEWGTELTFERGGSAESVRVLGGGETRLVDSWGNVVARVRGDDVTLDVLPEYGPFPYLAVAKGPVPLDGFEVRVRTAQETLSTLAR